jgi:ribonuclease P protein subunit POP4
MITRENLLAHELIGLRVLVVRSTSLPFIGLEGRVIDETKNTLVIESKKGELRIPKKTCTFRFYFRNESAVVDGKEIAYRPEDRPKKCYYGKMRR